MKQYLYSIVAVSVVSAPLSELCPDGTSLKKYFTFLTSAALLCATVAPVASLIEGFSTGEGLFTEFESVKTDYGTVWLESLTSTTKEETERAVRAHICEKFDISEGNVTVVCTFSQKDGDLSLTAIEVTLSSSALMKNPRQIESYIEENLKIPCTVADGPILQSE